VMSQLDRQMVLNSYAGIDLSTASPSHMQSFNQHQQNSNPPLLSQPGSTTSPADNLDPFNLDAFSHHARAAAANNHAGVNGTSAEVGGGFWGDPSTAWFMPFNMEPPSIGEDNNLFSNNSGFDWNGFNGLGDLAGIAPTGLTPGLTPGPVEIDTGPDGGVNGMEGFETAI
jgi:hypothetical protein